MESRYSRFCIHIDTFMFSYRHAFHAGNHGDVLKHSVLVQILTYFTQKEVGFSYFDTHAGGGLYALESAWPTKTGEHLQGVQKLWDQTKLPSLCANYMSALRALNPDGKLRTYPGSPWLALQILREQDRLRLFELHPTEVNELTENLRRFDRAYSKRVVIQHADGFAALKASLPPRTRRGMILIDPPYEDKSDYKRVVKSLSDALRRFATGCYMVWYPIISRREARLLVDQLHALPAKNWLDARLNVDPLANTDRRLRGSGVFVINPPYTLQQELEEGLPWLAKTLGVQLQGTYELETKSP